MVLPEAKDVQGRDTQGEGRKSERAMAAWVEHSLGIDEVEGKIPE